MAQEVEGTRAGVRHIEVGEEHAGGRLDNFLARLLPSVPRSRIYRLVRKGEVRVNGRRARPEQRLEPSDNVRVPPVRIDAEPRGPARPPPQLLELIAQAVIHQDERPRGRSTPAGPAVPSGGGRS